MSYITDDIIEVAFLSSSLARVYKPNGFWDKARWLLVKWLGGDNPNEDARVTRIRFSVDDFIRRMHEQRRYVFQHHNVTPTRVIMGAEDFEDVMSMQSSLNNVFSFHASYPGGLDGRPTVFGMEVTVIPWMRGCVVLP